MRFSLSRHLREVWRGGARANAPSRRATTWAGGSSLEGLEDRKLLSLANVAVAEGNVNQANFVIRLPFAPKAPFLANAKTFDESAKAPAEYTSTTSVVTFQPGQKVQVVTVPVTSDKDFEFHEVFGLQVDVPGRTRYGIARVLNFHGAIPHPHVSNPTVVEAGNGPFQAPFVVSLSFTPKSPLVFSYKTFDESAKAGTDYTAVTAPPSPPLVFGPGLPTSITVPVPVATEPGFHFPKRFGLEVDGPGRVAFGIATIKWIHPRNPIPRVSNPVVIETAGT
jgi:hypothetical protein